jgi:hypothetical protein
MEAAEKATVGTWQTFGKENGRKNVRFTCLLIF